MVVKELEMNRLRLIFEEDQMVSLEEFLPRPYGPRFINPYVYIDEQSYRIKKIENFKNEIRLEIENLAESTRITFLPSFFSDDNSVGYDGPVIKNSSGFSALTFYNYPIKTLVSTPTYTQAFYSEKKVLFQLSPGVVENCLNCVLKVERKKTEDSNYEQRPDIVPLTGLFSIDSFGSSEIDTQSWDYRIKLENERIISPQLSLEIKICEDVEINDLNSFQGVVKGNNLTGNQAINQPIGNVLFQRSVILSPGFETQFGQTFAIVQKNCMDQ
jgi:hypothetical protein